MRSTVGIVSGSTREYVSLVGAGGARPRENLKVGLLRKSSDVVTGCLTSMYFL